MEARRVTASGLVYLFGEEFADPAEGRLSGSQTQLIHSGQKVGSVSLAHSLFLAAFVSLAHDGRISLRVEKRSGLLALTGDAVRIIPREPGDDLPPSLEREIMLLFQGDTDRYDVREAVWWVTGRRTLADNVKWTVGHVIDVLAEAGYLEWVPEPGCFFGYEVHWWAESELIAPLVGEVETLKNRIRAFDKADHRLYSRLVEEVHAGLSGGAAGGLLKLLEILEWL